MSNTWGRPPRKDFWQDLQALALWLVIIGVAVYIIFPNFFKDIYANLLNPVSQTSTLNMDDQLSSSKNNYLSLDSNSSPQLLGQDLSGVANNLSNGNNEISSGYWIIYVVNGGFKQLAVSSEAYAFLLRLIQTDQNSQGTSIVFLASNGQISKYTVSDEVYTIINNLSIIMARSK